ncbi:Guanine Nucleotide-Binding Protein-Like 3-Like Protein [Manis pentadactyla]|nr:Guanine Nucleotide-Binding Protein-Like 3-Like Protein [Manis pentadactyla]
MGTQLVKISVVLGAGGDIKAFPFPGPVDQNTGKKLMRIPQWILHPPNKISSETDLLLQMTLTKEQLCKTHLKLYCQVVSVWFQGFSLATVSYFAVLVNHHTSTKLGFYCFLESSGSLLLHVFSLASFLPANL